MAVDQPQIKIDPYTSTVPLVQLPVQEMDAGNRPNPPILGQFGKKGTGALAIGDSILKGFLQGHELKEKKKYAQATATIAAADKSSEDAYQQYQEALSSNKDPQATEAAYKNYTDIFNRSKAAKAQFVLPEKPAKGQKKDKKDGGGAFGGIKEFMAANPHIIPQIALATMQPKPPGASRETKEADLRTKQLETSTKLQDEQLGAVKEERARAAETDAKAKQREAVEAAGGVEAVLGDKKAAPELQQAARTMKYSALDAQSPEAKIKTQGEQDVLSGASKDWPPEKRMLMGAMGVVPMPTPTTVQGKNGRQQQILVDPTTNQPVKGSTPLDLGPPAWASEFYAKQGAARADIRKAVESDPLSFGIQPSSDPKANKAAIDARVDRLVVEHEFGIHTLAGSLGKTGYEVQRDNGYLEDASKDLNARFTTKAPVTSFDWPGGGRVDLTKDQANAILNQFVTDPTTTSQGGIAGVRAFRSAPEIQQGKDAGAAERDRQWAYQFVKGRMMAAKGKNALTSEQADDLLKNTALGRPITSGGPMTAPPEAPKGMFGRIGDWLHDRKTAAGLKMTPPPQPGAAMKLYMVPGYDQPVQLTDEEAQKARSQSIAVEPVDSLNQ